MKKIIMLISCLIIMAPIKVLAESNVYVETKVVGTVKKGSNIEILVDVKNVDNLYASSIDFIYDTKQLKVESIEATEYITKNIDNIMELGGETDKNGNTATYSFTFLGDVDGLMGAGTLVKINAKVLNNDKLSITKDNMKVKLVKKADGTVKNYDYNFIGYNIANDSNSGSSNGSSGGSSNDSSSGSANGNSSSGYNTGSSNSSGGSNSDNGNDVRDGNNSSENNDENKLNGEISSTNKDKKADEDKSSNSNDDKSEVSKNNLGMIIYVLIAIAVIGGSGYYYYKFRKNKNKDN